MGMAGERSRLQTALEKEPILRDGKKRCMSVDRGGLLSPITSGEVAKTPVVAQAAA